LCNDSVAEENKYENTKKFGERFSHELSDAAPKEIWLSLDNVGLGNLVVNEGSMLSECRLAKNGGASRGLTSETGNMVCMGHWRGKIFFFFSHD
jgi:hypothetical protein